VIDFSVTINDFSSSCHIKIECLNQIHKEKASEKKYGKNKQRRAYIAWEDNDTSSSFSSDKEEEANLYMMARHDTESSVSSSISLTHENYSTLLSALRETHEGANRLTLSNNRLKGLNSCLQSKVRKLE